MRIKILFFMVVLLKNLFAYFRTKVNIAIIVPDFFIALKPSLINDFACIENLP